MPRTYNKRIKTSVLSKIELRLLTVPQVAELLQLSERSIQSMIGSGQLPSLKIGGSRRVSLDAVQHFINPGAQVSNRLIETRASA